MFISLSGNYLKTIREYTFTGLINLNALDLSGKKLESIEKNAFKDLINVTYLFLQHNQITNLTPFLCDLKKLTNLVVSSNIISEFDTNTFKHWYLNF